MKNDEEKIHLPDGHTASLIHYESGEQKSCKIPVLITHGTFSGRACCDRISQYAAKRGFHVSVLEWRNRAYGKTCKGDRYDFRSLAFDETVQALQRLTKRHDCEQVHWIGHSGGGLLPAILLAEQPQWQSVFASITMVGSQSSQALGYSLSNRLRLETVNAIGNVLGYWPGRRFKVGKFDEPASLMAQWFHWNKSGFRSPSGSDYFDLLQPTDIPVLALSGSGDTLIAPPKGCLELANAFGKTAQYRECGHESGFSENFGHTQLWTSRAAAREIWPVIFDHIEKTEQNSSMV